MNKIDICRKTRQIAASTLAQTLQHFLSNNLQISEKDFADYWLSQLKKENLIFPQGWYTPPPGGIAVLFGTTQKNSRVNYQSLRPEEMWPKEDIFLDKENGMAYLFASAVDKESGIIGDFGLTIYFGNYEVIKEHLKRCFKVNKQIFDFIEVGKKFFEVFEYSKKIISEQGLENQVTSTTDPAATNIGHTIPASYFDWTKEERGILENAQSNWEVFKNMINEKRVFINPIEKFTFKPGMAVTLEPRLTVADNPNIPMGSYHTIVAINEDGTKELLTDFEEIFKVVGMDYIF